MNKEIFLLNIKVHLDRNQEFGKFFGSIDIKELFDNLINIFQKKIINKLSCFIEKKLYLL